MKLIATMPVRNEDWVLGLSLRVALLWCDAVVVLLHECTDGSADIVEQVIHEHDRGRLHVLRASGEWTEMQHRQAMLECAREHGATHIAIVDADEVVTSNVEMMMRYCSLLDRGSILQLPGYNLRGSLNRYHKNGIWGNRWFSAVFVDESRLSWNGDKFHSREAHGVSFIESRPVNAPVGGILHLWGASERRLRAKSALYKLTERIRWPQKPVRDIDRMYSWAIHGQPGHPSYGTPETWTYADVSDSWWAGYRERGWMKYLDVDAVPWQEAECRRLLAQHGTEITRGLDLFGVC